MNLSKFVTYSFLSVPFTFVLGFAISLADDFRPAYYIIDGPKVTAVAESTYTRQKREERALQDSIRAHAPTLDTIGTVTIEGKTYPVTHKHVVYPDSIPVSSNKK